VRAATQVLPGPFPEPVQPGALDRWLDLWHTQELPAAGQLGGDVAASQQAVMANADEAFGQHVEQEAADKLVGRQPHHLGAVIVRIILPVERHLAVRQRQQRAWPWLFPVRRWIGVEPWLVQFGDQTVVAAK